MGAEVVYYPCFEIRPPEHVEELDKALLLAAADHFDWIALTTASTVLVIAERLAAIGAEPNRLSSMKVAALGANTRLAAKEFLSLSRGDDLRNNVRGGFGKCAAAAAWRKCTAA